MDALRVGTVPYLVGRPLDDGLEHEPGIELVRRVPAELVRDLRAGELDVALVSSIELFRRPDYRYLAGLGVVGRGYVASVQVFLRTALSDVRRIALDPASRTAATLVRVLLDPRSPLPPPNELPQRAPIEFIEVPAGQDPRDFHIEGQSGPADAWLRIGDAALRETLAPDAPPAFNPAGAWQQLTGLPFVFAVWIVRPGVVIEPHVAAFARARRRGAQRVPELADEAAATWQLPRDACRRYLDEECRYSGGPELDQSLLRFRDAAAALELCQAGLAPRPVAVSVEHVS